MATRAYRRNSRGQFAGSGGRVTYGKAGGFANASHRAKAASAKSTNAAARAARRKRIKVAKTVGKIIGPRVALSVAIYGASKLAGPTPATTALGIGASVSKIARKRRGVYNISSL